MRFKVKMICDKILILKINVNIFFRVPKIKIVILLLLYMNFQKKPGNYFGVNIKVRFLLLLAIPYVLYEKISILYFFALVMLL